MHTISPSLLRDLLDNPEAPELLERLAAKLRAERHDAPEGLVTLPRASRHLGFSDRTGRRRFASGNFPLRPVGTLRGSPLFRWTDLLRFLDGGAR